MAQLCLKMADNLQTCILEKAKTPQRLFPCKLSIVQKQRNFTRAP